MSALIEVLKKIARSYLNARWIYGYPMMRMIWPPMPQPPQPDDRR